jgi:hypothetical protein
VIVEKTVIGAGQRTEEAAISRRPRTSGRQDGEEIFFTPSCLEPSQSVGQSVVINIFRSREES